MTLGTRLREEEEASALEVYRHLHRHPELSMQEHETARYVEERLEELGIEHFRCGGTGVVGILRNGPGPVVGFRADIDGLPILERTGADYASKATGTLPDGAEVPVMHGCGHDVHLTAALFAARLLGRQRGAWAGTIVWIFQPGEETGAGSAAMVADGLWDRAPRPEVVLGQHITLDLPAGAVELHPGPALASSEALLVRVRGRQSHGARPADGIDPIVLGAHMIVRLQTVVSREISPLAQGVLTCGTFHGGVSTNVIPDGAEFTVSLRALDERVRDRMREAVERIVEGEAAASGAPAPELEPISSFPLLRNDPQCTELVGGALRREFGPENVVDNGPRMGSEDFGRLPDSISVPGVYWFFGGAASVSPTPRPAHSPDFLPDAAPAIAAGVRAAVAALGRCLAD